jgi:hypothetical protein
LPRGRPCSRLRVEQHARLRSLITASLSDHTHAQPEGKEASQPIEQDGPAVVSANSLQTRTLSQGQNTSCTAVALGPAPCASPPAPCCCRDAGCSNGHRPAPRGPDPLHPPTKAPPFSRRRAPLCDGKQSLIRGGRDCIANEVRADGKKFFAAKQFYVQQIRSR